MWKAEMLTVSIKFFRKSLPVKNVLSDLLVQFRTEKVICNLMIPLLGRYLHCRTGWSSVHLGQIFVLCSCSPSGCWRGSTSSTICCRGAGVLAGGCLIWATFPTEYICSIYCAKLEPPHLNCVELKQRVTIVAEEVLGWMYDLIAAV